MFDINKPLIEVETLCAFLIDDLKAFIREALVWKQLHHENILPFIGVDVDTFQGIQCLVTPWQELGSLASFRKNPNYKSDRHRMHFVSGSFTEVDLG